MTRANTQRRLLTQQHFQVKTQNFGFSCLWTPEPCLHGLEIGGFIIRLHVDEENMTLKDWERKGMSIFSSSQNHTVNYWPDVCTAAFLVFE